MKIGQIALDDNFMLSTYAQLFLNTAFGDMPSRAATSNEPVCPLAAPGLYFYSKPGDDWFIRAAIYTSDARNDVVDNNGLGWKLDGDAGFSIILWNPASKPCYFVCPPRIRSASFTTRPILTNSVAAEQSRATNIYAVTDQVLWLVKHRKPLLGVFVRVGVNPLADRTGVALPYNRFTDASVRASANDGRKISEQEVVLEITYQAILTPWFTLQPDIQFVLDPAFSRRDAYV